MIGDELVVAEVPVLPVISGLSGVRTPRVVRVVPDVAAVHRVFDYSVPDHLDASVRVGTQVRVVLAGRRVAAWVVADNVVPPEGVELSPLASVRGWGPPDSVVELAQWAAWRWAGPVAGFLGTASSRMVVAELPEVPQLREVPELTVVPELRELPELTVAPISPASHGAQVGSPGASQPGNTVEQSVHDAAGDHGAAGSRVAGSKPADYLEPIGVTASDLLAGGVAVLRLAPAIDPFPVIMAAVRSMGPALGSNARAPSGADAIPGVLVLAPSQQRAARAATRLRQVGLPVALLPDEWSMARAGGCVVVGSRAAAFAPLPLLSAAVVIDAHDESYHEERAPTWSAWAVVAERARRDGAPCVLISPCPTVDLLDSGRLVSTPRSVERHGWPPFEVVDRRDDDPRTGLFSPQLVHLVRWACEVPGRRVLCVVNRTGRVRLLGCASCRELARCERCAGALESGAEAAILRCRRCGYERPMVCARCGSTSLKALRLGTTRVKEDLEALVGSSVAEVTGLEQSPDLTPVVVGTEALLHRVPIADAVAFLDFDSELLAPRYAAAEQAMALLARAARVVAGRSETSSRARGRVLVQTRQPGHEALKAAVSADPGLLSASELELRQMLELPPVSAMARVSGAMAGRYVELLRIEAPADMQIGGSAADGWSLKAPNHQTLCDLLGAVKRPAGRMRVEVDPVRS